jgi:hypothetical protein
VNAWGTREEGGWDNEDLGIKQLLAVTTLTLAISGAPRAFAEEKVPQTAAEHEAAANDYRTKAKGHRAEAEMHRNMAEMHQTQIKGPANRKPRAAQQGRRARRSLER